MWLSGMPMSPLLLRTLVILADWIERCLSSFSIFEMEKENESSKKAPRLRQPHLFLVCPIPLELISVLLCSSEEGVTLISCDWESPSNTTTF
jgi:hypothetical protein